jgi:hypothetical protein
MPVFELKDSYLMRCAGNAAGLAVPSSLIGLIWGCRVEILVAILYGISQAQLDSARHPDLLSELIMSGATAKKAAVTLYADILWGGLYSDGIAGLDLCLRPHRRSQELGLLAAGLSTLGLLFSLRWKWGDLCFDEFKISCVWRLRYPNSR